MEQSSQGFEAHAPSACQHMEYRSRARLESHAGLGLRLKDLSASFFCKLFLRSDASIRLETCGLTLR